MRKIVTDREKLELFLKLNDDYRRFEKYTVGNGKVFTFNRFGTVLKIRDVTNRLLADLERNAFNEKKKYTKKVVDKGEDV